MFLFIKKLMMRKIEKDEVKKPLHLIFNSF